MTTADAHLEFVNASLSGDAKNRRRRRCARIQCRKDEAAMHDRLKSKYKVAVLTVLFATGAAVAPAMAARVRHHTHRAVARAPVAQAAPERQGVVGYFGPGAYGPNGYGPGAYGGYGYGYDRHNGDLGFALLGAMNGGGL